MTIVKTYDVRNNILPFNNTECAEDSYNFVIGNHTIHWSFEEIINTQFTGGNVGGFFEILKDRMGVGISSKAPCGGFANFFHIKSQLDKSFVIFSGVNEVANSRYVVTVHKIVEIKF